MLLYLFLSCVQEEQSCQCIHRKQICRSHGRGPQFYQVAAVSLMQQSHNSLSDKLLHLHHVESWPWGLEVDSAPGDTGDLPHLQPGQSSPGHSWGHQGSWEGRMVQSWQMSRQTMIGRAELLPTRLWEYVFDVVTMVTMLWSCRLESNWGEQVTTHCSDDYLNLGSPTSSSSSSSLR